MVKEPEPFVCPHCQVEIVLPDLGECEEIPCPKCRHSINLLPQCAYIRGLAAFAEGQDIIVKVSPRKRIRNPFLPQLQEAADLYVEAYSALQQAFLGDLGENQRKLAIEMMAAISQLFLMHNMISPLEANYWHLVMVEKTTQQEIEELCNKVKGPIPFAVIGYLFRWRWQLRIKQLVKSLSDLNRKIKNLEHNIGFIEPLRARKLP
jgi:hypothetical protein